MRVLRPVQAVREHNIAPTVPRVSAEVYAQNGAMLAVSHTQAVARIMLIHMPHVKLSIWLRVRGSGRHATDAMIWLSEALRNSKQSATG